MAEIYWTNKSNVQHTSAAWLAVIENKHNYELSQMAFREKLLNPGWEYKTEAKASIVMLASGVYLGMRQFMF